MTKSQTKKTTAYKRGFSPFLPPEEAEIECVPLNVRGQRLGILRVSQGRSLKQQYKDQRAGARARGGSVGR